MLNVHGLVVIPKDSQLQISESQGGACYLNFKACSEGREVSGKPNISYWDCNMYVPAAKKDEWVDAIQPSSVLFVEHGTVELVTLPNLKIPLTRVRLDSNRVKQMSVPLWAKKDKT